MYNEVFKRCPECQAQGTSGGYLQIRQIVLGFGGFDLDDPNDLNEKLTLSQLVELENTLSEEAADNAHFRCLSCSATFPLLNGHAQAKKDAIISRITRTYDGRNTEETEKT